MIDGFCLRELNFLCKHIKLYNVMRESKGSPFHHPLPTFSNLPLAFSNLPLAFPNPPLAFAFNSSTLQPRTPPLMIWRAPVYYQADPFKMQSHIMSFVSYCEYHTVFLFPLVGLIQA